MLDGGEQLSVGAAGGAHRLEGLDELVPLPLVSEAGVEIRGRQTEQPPVLVRPARLFIKWEQSLDKGLFKYLHDISRGSRNDGFMKGNHWSLLELNRTSSGFDLQVLITRILET